MTRRLPATFSQRHQKTQKGPVALALEVLIWPGTTSAATSPMGSGPADHLPSTGMAAESPTQNRGSSVAATAGSGGGRSEGEVGGSGPAHAEDQSSSTNGTQQAQGSDQTSEAALAGMGSQFD